ncbi:unnamed protein product [Penicillium nalgiovense]|uniref:Mid2 domain-containing protein n=2 Tax=Penicillium TaxID=5073 RepID=A0A1V6W7M3_PENNA|nr:hypothetical protein PENNAL_c0353G03835 [Penicillium nalgiovense]OQE58958.1 hypothetical protein PENNAL_c0349G08145 [Penicillium nalgiovense]CAG8071124.1 unnamed protein product [Penicillium nalgiovense]CAG8075767.1 unnamed protein product [Penicillium nalgiovense]CAG8081154.1 unnamed protein product [Penicillium nalgiovense]
MANLAWVWLLMISVSQMAQSAPTRTVWRTPSGNNEDFVTTYYIGSTLTIDWSGWDSSILNRDMNGTSKADLWVNAWNTDFSTWSKKISTSTIDVSYSGTFVWKVAIDEEALSDTNEYGLTFKPTGESFAPSNPRLYSPGFYVKSNETTSTSTSATSFIPMTSTTPTSTPTSETASSNTGALSTGAKVGTGVGVSVAGLAVLSALAFVLFQRRLRSSPQEMTGSRDQAPDGSSYMKPQPAPQELFAPPPEIESTTNTRREIM